MPYDKKSELPDNIKDNLPSAAQDIYKKAFNSAWKDYKNAKDRKGNSGREETAHKVAWSAVKKEYHKKDGEWVRDKS